MTTENLTEPQNAEAAQIGQETEQEETTHNLDRWMSKKQLKRSIQELLLFKLVEGEIPNNVVIKRNTKGVDFILTYKISVDDATQNDLPAKVVGRTYTAIIKGIKLSKVKFTKDDEEKSL